MFKDVPLFLLALLVSMYWGTVVLLVLYKRVRHGRSAGLWPRQAYERGLWFLIVPVVAAWIVLPILAGKGSSFWFSLPLWAHDMHLVYAIRWLAAALAVGCYLLSLYCWFLMGSHWSMAIVPQQTAQLVSGGLYRYVRHPIYGLSIALVLASAVVVPTVPMAGVAGLHLLAMNLKASNEERHLEESFGSAYTQYCRTVGRFWPRFFSQAHDTGDIQEV